MAKYGDAFKYGTAEKYGTAGATEEGEVTWVLMVDWDADGIFDGTNEAGRLTDFRMIRGNKHYLSTGGAGFAPMRGGTVTLTLDNHDRRYDPRYTSSPLYPNVGPGKLVYLRVINNSDQTNYDILKGVIADIRPLNGPGGAKQVRMVVNDYMQEISQAECTGDASELSTYLSNAFQVVLDDIGFKGTISIDSDTQPIPMLNITDKNAGSVVNQLAEAGLGMFFVDRLGTAKYFGRNHSGYTNHSIDEDVCLTQILVSQPWDYVYNHVSINVQRPIWKQPCVVYSLPNPEAINAGTNVTINARYQDSNNVEIRTYKANTLANGSGTDITDDITIVSQSLGGSGGSVVLSTSTNGFITRLELHGRMLGVVREDAVATDATSISSYGRKKLRIDTPYMQDPHYANVFAEVIKDITKNDRESITIEIQQRPSVQYPIDIMHTVAFTSGTLTIDDTYYITGYEHRWNNDTGQDVTTTIWLHKIITDATSITASAIEEENYVPTDFEEPSDTPWLPPDEPPGWIDPPGGGGGVPILEPMYGYAFIPALGGENSEEDTFMGWGGCSACGGQIGDAWAHMGVWMFPNVNSSGAAASGCYMVPVGVTRITFIPITTWGDVLPSGSSIITRSTLNGFLADMSYGAYNLVQHTYSTTPTRGYYSRAFLTELTMYDVSVVPGEYLNLTFQIIYPVTNIAVGFELMMHGWKALLS